MTQIMAPHGGYRKMLSFGFTCLAYHATTTFCARNFNYRNDSLGKTVGQLVGAARSARQNLVEASIRAGTSAETELRLLNVAIGSLQELAGDYEAFLIDRGEAPWSTASDQATAFRALSFDPFEPLETGDDRHAYGLHLLQMRKRFAPFLEPEDSVAAANGILLCIDRAAALLQRQIAKTVETFTKHGGFTERMSKARIEARENAPAEENAPACPECGAPMRRRLARKGTNAGHPFWSCSNYPSCKGTSPS